MRSVAVRRRGYSWSKDQETARADAGTVPVVRIPNIQQYLDLGDLLHLRNVSPDDLASFGVQQDWILYVASNGNPDRIGDSVLIADDAEMLFASFLQGLTSRRAEELRPAFLARWLQLDTVHQSFSKTSQKTTGLANFSWSAVKSLPVRYPVDVAEQDAILNILAAADSGHCDAGQLESARRMMRSLINELFLHGTRDDHPVQHGKWLTCPERWTPTRLRRLADIDSGFTMGRDLRGADTVSMSYVTVVNVQEGRLNLDSLSTTMLKTSEVDAALLKAGDVLMTEGGDRDKLGRGAIWTGEIEPCTYQNHIFRVRLDESKYRSKLFEYLLQSRGSKRYFASHAKQTSNLCTINSREVARFEVGVPEVREQDEMLDQLEAADGLIAALEAKQARRDRLSRALLETFLRSDTRIESLVNA